MAPVANRLLQDLTHSERGKLLRRWKVRGRQLLLVGCVVVGLGIALVAFANRRQLTLQSCGLLTDISTCGDDNGSHLDAAKYEVQNGDELTVVTAFFNIGQFPKGVARGNMFTPQLYRQWMTSFALIENPLMVYVDNDEDLEYFRSVRRNFPANRTRFIRLQRQDTWTFSPTTVAAVSAIFKQPGYARHYPNTVVPEYALAMHAKYEVMQLAIRSNPFRTQYFCWLDVGLFRDLASTASPASSTSSPNSTSVLPSIPHRPSFLLSLPPNFSESAGDSIAVCEIRIYNRSAKATPKQIVYENLVWIGGGFFLGRRDVMERWIREYTDAVRWMIAERILSTDQQVIYSMFNAAELGLRTAPTTKLVRYRGDGRYNDWFHLAYVCREEGMKQAASAAATIASYSSNKV